MRAFLKKLRSPAGETLAETLAALLVVTCGSVLLATMLMTAARLNQTAAEQDAAFYRDLTLAETARNEGSDNVVSSDTIIVTERDTTKQHWFAVDFYGSPSDPKFTSYRLAKGAG